MTEKNQVYHKGKTHAGQAGLGFELLVSFVLFVAHLMHPHEPIPAEDEELARRLIGAAIEVHRILGPGFLENIYRKAVAHELSLQGIQVEQEKDIVVPYKDVEILGQRLDLLVGGRIIAELKCVEEFAPIHQAQLMSYLKATRLRLGLLINFKVQMLKDGIKRVVL